jgi:hypothetical protein
VRRYHARMWQYLAFGRMRPDTLALNAHVERAGTALACAYSSSDEFEAAVVRANRAAGVYGPRRHRRLALGLGVAAVVLVILVAMI